MQGLVSKKEGSNVVVCPRCGAKNITAQSQCGKCGFIFPQTQKDAHLGKDSFGATGGGTAQQNRGPMQPQAMGGPPVAGEGETGAGEVQLDEQGNPIEAPKMLTEHQKMQGFSEGPIMERGEWEKCARCGADVKAEAVRCMHCGWKIGKKKN